MGADRATLRALLWFFTTALQHLTMTMVIVKCCVSAIAPRQLLLRCPNTVHPVHMHCPNTVRPVHMSCPNTSIHEHIVVKRYTMLSAYAHLKAVST